MLKKSTIQLLRFHFSIFLLPIYLFALSESSPVNIKDAILIFVILHLLVYPASNGYNSYMDKDIGSIGGIKNPLPPTKELFYVSIFLDSVAIFFSFSISFKFTILLILYIFASRAYSYRGIRLKKYPIIGYLTVIFFQGAVTYVMVYSGVNVNKAIDVPLISLAASSALIGGFYPLTQIYQHQQDKEDGVLTLSALLGVKKTFYFTAIIYSIAMTLLSIHYFLILDQFYFFVLQLFLLPVFIYFIYWFLKVRKNETEANFNNTMRMNIIASLFTNAGFITILILKYFE